MADKLSRAKLARVAWRLNRASHSDLPPLVLMTDDERLPDPLAAAAVLPRGSMVILRTRDWARRAAMASALLPIVRERHLTLSIANDPDLARRIGAHGVHFSEAAMREASHWRVLRPHWILTVPAHSLAACATAKRLGADAVLLSPIFATRSHPGEPHFGAVRAMLIARQSPLPVYALGGINAASASQLKDSRFAGLAAIGALHV
ncbi:MAG TPA: thiamine phosphate synthase [Rhizomicrobium sp.]|jgi:thiamine-phosphate pyrophosphorylase